MPKGFHQLTQDLRCQISRLKSMDFSQRAIAKELNISPSTVCRELKRNSDERGYCYIKAHERAITRRNRASSIPRKMIPELIKIIEKKLCLYWSPEQIAGRLALEEGIKISHETIYRFIWKDKRKGGSLYRSLRHHRKKYKKRSSNKAGRSHIPNRVDIKERPAIVEEKSRVGDWEGDTIIGRNHKGAIVSLVDRCSKFTLLKKVNRKTAEEVRDAIIEKMKNFRHLLETSTFDNGGEFALWEDLYELLGLACYFATPYRSCERGLNEHTNGLVRQFIRKSTDLSEFSDEDIQRIEDLLNDRPRKALKYKTPREVFNMAQFPAVDRIAASNI